MSSFLFVSSWGNRLDGGDIHRTFYMLCRQIGLRGASDSHGPRLHDMRHRFATHTLVHWYRSLTSEQAKLCQEWLENHRRLKNIIRKMEKLSLKETNRLLRKRS